MRFLESCAIEEARKAVEAHISLKPQAERVVVEKALGRVLWRDVAAELDVPGFDRATMDGYAVRAEDTYDADETSPARLRRIGDVAAGVESPLEVGVGEAVAIATGAPVPKGANAVVKVEHTRELGEQVEVYRAVWPGENIAPAGEDISAGEVVARRGDVLTSPCLGLLTALGYEEVEVYRRPRVAVLSTGNELLQPGAVLQPGRIYDVNSPVLASLVRESGGEAVSLGIARDEMGEIRRMLRRAVGEFDILITSGGTSKGAGDLLAKAIATLGEPGVIVHGVRMKPGKPTVIGVVKGKPVFGLPGNPVSAVMAYQVFAAPMIRWLSGLGDSALRSMPAKAGVRLRSEAGRHEYLLVHILNTGSGAKVFPVPKGSGAISALAHADGYVEIPPGRDMVYEGENVEVKLLSGAELADLVFIGSHCLGVELLSKLLPYKLKTVYVGSTGGLSAVRKGLCDMAGVHLLHETGLYNLPFLNEGLALVKGYLREQGIMIQSGNPRGIEGLEDLVAKDVSFVTREPGSGTSLLLSHELARLGLDEGTAAPSMIVKSHTAAAAMVARGRADAAFGIKAAAARFDLDFIPVQTEEYDFIVPLNRLERRCVKDFIDLLGSERFRRELEALPGLRCSERTGRIIKA